MTEKTLEFFDYQARVYDRYQENCIPKYPEMIETSVKFLKRALTGWNTVSILDLGCGTGNTSQTLLSAFSDISLSCLDGSQSMLNMAKEKLDRPAGPTVKYYRHDLGDPSWPPEIKRSAFDAVISVLVLEHLPFDRYQNTIGRIYQFLKPGGWLITTEVFAGDLNLEIILGEKDQLEKNAIKRGLISEALLSEMNALSKDKESHYFIDVDAKMAAWKEAGFKEVQMIWKYYSVGTIVGVKQ